MTIWTLLQAWISLANFKGGVLDVRKLVLVLEVATIKVMGMEM
jgi:hypothetical protein